MASAGGSQLAPYVYGAGQVIWVAGAQKIVADVDEGRRRIQEHTYPLEDARMLRARGVHSHIGKILQINREPKGRATLILVREALGF